ncbi:MAG: ATP-grasp domain-containing protein [Myxococcota bacterium]|nr:ATP-grasp domain-containing protein [Myxococcota bacterium]
MRVAFLAPHYPAEMPRFVRALAEQGAEVIGVSDVPVAQLGDAARYLSRYVKTDSSLSDEARAHAELLPVLRALAPDQIEAQWEPIVLLAAGLRDALGLGGMSRDTVLGFRDKQLMKERLAAAGVRVPKSARATPGDELRDAVERIGLPVVVKPIAGAGTTDTFLVRDRAELERVVASVAHVPALIVEEFIAGEELTYDTVCVDGTPVFDSVAQYFPKPLESRTQEWISPGQIVFRDPHAQPELAPGIALGRQVLAALGMQTGFTHMEWFRTARGEAVFGEIASRAPGAKLVDQMNWANDFDVFRGWAQAFLDGSFREVAHRRFHVACVFKRALGRGRITQIVGLHQLRAALGPHIAEEALLPIGTPRRDWRNTLLSDGWIAVRHPDLATCRRMMQTIVDDLKLYAE